MSYELQLYDFYTGEESLCTVVRLQAMGYIAVKLIPNHGLCALYRFVYTIAIVVNLSDDGSYACRYCFSDLSEAIQGFTTWSGDDHPDANWIKLKPQELKNPLYIDYANKDGS